ncbi:MAG: aminoacetone oxidase family FAD-binding enzyme [Verrucomicrobiota bacterium]
MPEQIDLVLVGGGAASFFAAIRAGEVCPEASIRILEKTSSTLGKVKISGGGRCNVTHGCFDPAELVEAYPRGNRELRGAFHRFATGDTMDWFESRGVALKIEEDGRVFPTTDQSQTVIDCLNVASRRAGVEVMTRTELVEVERAEGGFLLRLRSGEEILAHQLVLGMGGLRGGKGGSIPESLGLRVTETAPSLFTFKIRDPRLEDLSGLAVEEAEVRINGEKLSATGPVLVTHWGLSGPGILKLSAWGARRLQQLDYRFEISINWTGREAAADVMQQFAKKREEGNRHLVRNDPIAGIPQRLWKRLVDPILGSEADTQRWSHLGKKVAQRIATELTDCQFRVQGQSLNKEEFVTCGGVALDQIDFRTMEARETPGLYVIGETLDVDGITGGYNFQAAWTTGWLAGSAAGANLNEA